MTRLRGLVAALRSPSGCPWDREQTHATLRGALIEECYETAEAIDAADDANLREELGDLLLHVVMHAQLACERGAFRLEDVVAQICEKLVRRHPHVFGGEHVVDSTEVLRHWDRIKLHEKGVGTSVVGGIPKALPALMRAQSAQRKAARVGFDWDCADDVVAKVSEEISEVSGALVAGSSADVAEEVGDLLFSIVNLARKLDVDAEAALAGSTEKFIRRFQSMERLFAEENRKLDECDLDEMNAIWERQKLTGS